MNLAPSVYNVTEEMRDGFTPTNITFRMITLENMDVMNINFTNQPVAPTFSISGFKINGTNNNGLGLENWNILLLNPETSAEIANIATNNIGFYKFSNLSNGTYNVTEKLKMGWINISPVSQIVTISGKDVTDVNFTNALVSPPVNGSISGVKFNDLNGNGTRDAGEPGLANWIITLRNSNTGAAIFNTTTASDGSYKFSNLSAGNYNVGEILNPNWTQTAPKPVPPGTYMVTITSAGEDVTGKDFGNMLVVRPVLGSISGFKINAASGMGIPNWTIRLVGIVGTGVNTKQIRKETITDSMGRWMFDNLPVGRYIIIEQVQKGYIPVSPPVKNIMLEKGQNSMNNNFTNRPVESLIPKLPLPPMPPVTEEQESK